MVEFFLIPNVPLVNVDRVPAAKRSKFFLEVHARMMRSLPFDVINNLSDVRLADLKCAVSILPIEAAPCRVAVLGPLGGLTLKAFDQLSDRGRARQAAK